jgi:FKBP-type peptidyl-prolyl cis-trans isomerase
MSHRFPLIALLSAAALTGMTFTHTARAQDEAATTPTTTQPAAEQPTTQPAAEATTQPAEEAMAKPAGDKTWTEHGEGIKSRVLKAAPEGAAKPKDTDFILVDMSMALPDGTVIQSTKDSGPLTIPLKDTTFLDGINIALRLLHEGEKCEFQIPPALAFGERGTPNGIIPPNTTLTFTAELVDILPGLQMTTTAEGEGAAAKLGDVVHVHYTGTLSGGEKDGTKFDSSYDHEGKAPLPVPLGAGRVIQGWEQGLVGIKPGEKRTLIIPAHLAYGDDGAGADIPPKATLKFEVECVKIEPGIVITTTKEGEGDPAKNGDVVSVHYTGTLSGGEKDGEKFDSSRDRGEPFQFPLGAGYVIKGWDIGVVGMKPGEQRTLIIPASWGYGPFGAGDRIPPNATLKFDVELVEIVSK